MSKSMKFSIFLFTLLFVVSNNLTMSFGAARTKNGVPGYEYIRDLGVGYYKTGRYDDAIDRLMEAQVMNTKDAKTVFYLGMANEKKNNMAAALKQYKKYVDLSASGGFRKKISRRIVQINNEQVNKAIAQAVTSEQAINVESIPDNTVAVLDFENLSKSSQLDPLRKGLAQMLITDLAKAKELTVVERLRLNKLVKEMQLAESGLVDQKSAPRVGKLVGAKKLVKGGFTDLTDKNIRIDASLAETGTSRIAPISELTGDLERIFRMEKQLAFKIIDEMGVNLTTEEREAIEKIPTESLLAFMAYSRGIDYEDRGMFAQAKAEYQKALSIDPNFGLAKQNLTQAEVASAASTAKTDIAQIENEFDATFAESSGQPANRLSRLVNTSIAAQTGHTAQGNDSREPDQELPTPSVTVPVKVKLPNLFNQRIKVRIQL